MMGVGVEGVEASESIVLQKKTTDHFLN